MFEVEEENLRAAHRAEILRPLSAGVSSWAQLPVFTGQSDQRQEFVQGVVRSFSTHRLLAGPIFIHNVYTYYVHTIHHTGCPRKGGLKTKSHFLGHPIDTQDNPSFSF